MEPILSRRCKLATISELATLLNVSVKTIYWWVNRLEIPYIKVGKHLRFDPDEVLRFFDEKTKKENRRTCLAASFPLNCPDYWSLKTEREPLLKHRERQ